MTFNEIFEKLQTDNEQFNLFLKTYFIFYTRLEEVIVSQYSFKNIYIEFKHAIREFSITHSRIIEECESPSWRTLFRKNGFSSKEFKVLVIGVNEILRSYTDEIFPKDKRRRIIEKQILNFASSFIHEMDDSIHYKMFTRLPKEKDYDHLKYTYIDSVLDSLKEAGIHQVEDGEYLSLSKLFNLHEQMLEYFKYSEYREKKKYLKKLNGENRSKALRKFINKMRTADDFCPPESDQALLKIRWFLIYLIYGKHKTDIFMIHSILGYKYDGVINVYQKLFLKDHSTGKNDDFLLHRDLLRLEYYHFDDENYYLIETISRDIR